MSHHITDHELIEKIKKGDQASFTILVNRHKNYALTIAKRIVLVQEDAEEIAHDAFVKAYTSLGSFKYESKFTTWFYRIVVNMAISRGRKKKLDVIEISEGHSDFVGDSGTAELDTKDRNYYLNLAISRLSQDDRLIITLYYLDELDMEEVAAISGFDKNNLKVKLHRARKRLGEILKVIMPTELESVVH
ncbi:sigma-70 family RNA polymerase sigma factor [Reichenbachiella agarivorans]|uniref:Sigma-70 family RNA polymerase sigma factor n=1 Tax=Reichenbachiella agarivorans TaxID=2979464 RepID=A0ABY6CQ69_9BACT|nr:sigma-70 family RNA polymerase sigma factor [Reichenbachiella agarivorans]UXP32646.1 sigma-70 family RNA polymerase sigma factor [Reichenbachiella agarivorans]